MATVEAFKPCHPRDVEFGVVVPASFLGNAYIYLDTENKDNYLLIPKQITCAALAYNWILSKEYIPPCVYRGEKGSGELGE